MTTWLKALLLFSVPATAISALGIYHEVKGDQSKQAKDTLECCKKCSEECKNKECCKQGQQCSESNCSEECFKCCKK